MQTKPNARTTEPLCPGFTLIEILVVISIISVLASLTLVAIQEVNARANETAARAQIALLNGGLELFRYDEDEFPGQDEALPHAENRFPVLYDARLGHAVPVAAVRPTSISKKNMSPSTTLRPASTAWHDGERSETPKWSRYSSTRGAIPTSTDCGTGAPPTSTRSDATRRTTRSRSETTAMTLATGKAHRSSQSDVRR